MMSASELLARYRAKSLSPVEATRAALARIARHDQALNAFILVCEDEAMDAARASEARWMRGEPLGSLDGVPTTIKDLLLMKGHPMRRGSLTTTDAPVGEDAPATARLREHGAVLIGKTNVPEFGWKGVTDSALQGITRNPWNPGRTAGGSSGGSGASVAACMGALALGSDGAGSIRMPAAFTGVFGLKPTAGRVPVYPPAVVGSCATVGPMTRTVRDAALMMNVIACDDPRDWISLRNMDEDYLGELESGVAGLRVAYSPTLGYASADADVAEGVRRAALRFEELGARVEEVARVFVDPREQFENFYRVSMAIIYRDLTDEQKKVVDPGFAEMAQQGLALDLFTYVTSERLRMSLGATVNRLLTEYDLLLTPQVSLTAFEAGREYPSGRGMRRWFDWSPFAYPFNFTGHPAASVPCGFNDAQLPLAFQLVGRRYDEALVLRAARAYENSAPFAMPPLES
jgi:aspartyl-tRNA(Asn)/glutamyl-tRNA(Gln) amidotransferase subunit A